MNAATAFALAQALFHFLWQGAAVALLLSLALAASQRRSARLRYALACLAMLAMLAAFAATLAWFWPHPVSSVTVGGAAKNPVFAPPLWLGYEARWAQQRPALVDWVAPLWLLGVLLLSLRSLFGWIAAARLKRTGTAAAPPEWQARLARLAEAARVSKPAALVASCLTEIPVVVGFLRPVILVPAQLLTGFPPQQLELILLHELAHIRRYDYLVNLLQSFAEDLLFYHPAVWWVSSVIRAERENCCDDAVVAANGDPGGLAEALAALEQQRWIAQQATLAANGGRLMHRIQRLLGQRTTPRLAGPAFFSCLVPLAFVVVAVVARAQSPAPPPLPDPPAPKPPRFAGSVQNVTAPAQNSQVAQVIDNQAGRQAAQRAKEEARLKRELEDPYKKWLNQEVVYIITNEERRAFLRLTTAAERENFIRQFWLRRDPTPDTIPNEYREEIYRRTRYANENFGTNSIPGWKTDRGMIYIKYGRPDERDEHPSGGFYTEPGGTSLSVVHPFEDWRYRFIEGIGKDVAIKFVDSTGTGDYHMTMDPTKTATQSMPASPAYDRQTGQPVQPCSSDPNAAAESRCAELNRFDRLRRLGAPDLQAPKP